MFKENRHEKILEMIQQNGSVKTTDLAKLFNTTRQTIHNDLDILDNDGKLKKVYGGAVRISKSEEPSIDMRRIQNKSEKNNIGQVAATFVNEKDTIFLDVSTTVTAMVPYIKECNDLTVITNSIEIAYRLGTQTNFEIYMVGGHVRAYDLAVGGNEAIQTLENIFVDKSFFGAGGVSITAGFTDYHFTDSQIRKVMIQNSNQAYVLFDETKIGTITISKYADFSEIDQLISYNVHDKDFLDFIDKEQYSFIDAKKYFLKDNE